MNTIITTLHSIFQKALTTLFSTINVVDHPIEIAQSTQAMFGHYQYNSAMKLAKVIGKPPRQIAAQIAESVRDIAQQDFPDMIASIEIAGPGFINITLHTSFIAKYVDTMLRQEKFGISIPTYREKIIVDFSSPNTAKEMHVGHLRSTIIGDSIARLFEFLGHDVLRLNHIGDWGTAFGMLIAYLKMFKPEIIAGAESTDLGHLVSWYKKSKELFDRDETFKKQSQLEVVALQSGNPESRKAWNIICDISRKAYQEIYDLLDIKLIERGESFYNPMLPSIIEELEKKNLITISDGAKCIFMDGFYNAEGKPLPLIVQKADGGYNYASTDMATIKHRIFDEKADRIIYVTDSGQSLHFTMIFKAAELAGYLDRTKVRVDHVGFGLVLGSDGKKFRTRSGDTERLVDLINAAILHAHALLTEKNPTMSSDEKKELAHSLGIAAIKYADLSSNRLHDYTFSYERMLRFEGNTAAFIMYASVRAQSIKRRIGIPLDQIINTTHINLAHPTEIALGIHLAQFQECLMLVAQDLFPNRLTDYLFSLAEKFNAFFRDCRVEGSDHQNERLLLCEIASQVLAQGLIILGIEPVEKM